MTNEKDEKLIINPTLFQNLTSAERSRIPRYSSDANSRIITDSVFVVVVVVCCCLLLLLFVVVCCCLLLLLVPNQLNLSQTVHAYELYTVL